MQHRGLKLGKHKLTKTTELHLKQNVKQYINKNAIQKISRLKKQLERKLKACEQRLNF